jgi:hypothetical protein
MRHVRIHCYQARCCLLVNNAGTRVGDLVTQFTARIPIVPPTSWLYAILGVTSWIVASERNVGLADSTIGERASIGDEGHEHVSQR